MLNRIRWFLYNFSIFIALITPILICEIAFKPTRRGFFCNDETIAYPYQQNTVKPWVLGLLTSLLPVICFIVVEFKRSHRDVVRGMEHNVVAHQQAPSRLSLFFKQLGCFFVGQLLTLNITGLSRFTMGRLRPHFMAVCQPQLLDGSNCADTANHGRYIEGYICVADGFTVKNVQEARLSFPSGHASLIFYTMVYLVFYLQRQLSLRGSYLICHLLQFTLLTVAWVIALSRVMDTWDHWSDVLVGSLLGIAIALFTAVYIAKLFDRPTMHNAVIIETEQRQQHNVAVQDHRDVLAGLPNANKDNLF